MLDTTANYWNTVSTVSGLVASLNAYTSYFNAIADYIGYTGAWGSRVYNTDVLVFQNKFMDKQYFPWITQKSLEAETGETWSATIVDADI